MRIALRISGLLAATALAGLQTVSAAASSSQVESPVPSPILNPCNGELVITTGTMHLVVTSVSSGRHFHTRFNFQDVKGVGAVTGFDYIVSEVSQDHVNFDFSKRFHDELTTLLILHVIAPGTGQHFVSPMLLHVTFTPSMHFKLTSHGEARCISMSAPGHLVVGERLKDTPSVATGVGTPTAAASSAPTAAAPTAGPGSRAASRESAQGAANGVRSHGLKRKSH